MTTRCPSACLFVFVLIPCVAHSDTVVEGRVELPKATALAVVNKRYQVVTKGGETTINPPQGVVWLDGNFGKPAVQPVVQMVQKNLAFTTPLLPVQVGTKVEFPNHDDMFHNIFSFSPTKRFDLGRYRPEERPIPSQVFDKAGLITLRCDIHEHMRGLIVVLDTPHFVKTDNEGHFKLGGLPAGNYKLKAWLDSKTTLDHAVDLKEGATARVNFP